MASIQEYLDLIKNAIYGKDVRQAIHDGIQQCYLDASGDHYEILDREIGILRNNTKLLKSNKVNQPLDVNNQPTNGISGQSLRTKGDGTTEWASVGLPTDAQTAEAITEWLNAHPEATTTVQDESLTNKKLVLNTLGFVTPQMFGAVGNGISDDTQSFQRCFSGAYKRIRIPQGTYLISNTIVIPDETEVSCIGTIKKVGSFDVLFDVGNNCDIQLKIDIDKASETDVSSQYSSDIHISEKENVRIHDTSIINTDSRYAIWIEKCSHVVIDRCYIDTYVYAGIGLRDGNDDVKVLFNSVLNGHGVQTNRYAIILNSSRGVDKIVSKNIVCNGNYVEDQEPCWEGIDAHDLVDSIISNNTVVNTVSGIVITYEDKPSKNLVISGNTYKCDKALTVSASTFGLVCATLGGSSNIVISNNVLTGCGNNSSISDKGGIKLYGVENLTVSNNTINCVGGSGIQGFSISSRELFDFNISNNIIDGADIGVDIINAQNIDVYGDITNNHIKNCNTGLSGNQQANSQFEHVVYAKDNQFENCGTNFINNVRGTIVSPSYSSSSGYGRFGMEIENLSPQKGRHKIVCTQAGNGNNVAKWTQIYDFVPIKGRYTLNSSGYVDIQDDRIVSIALAIAAVDYYDYQSIGQTANAKVTGSGQVRVYVTDTDGSAVTGDVNLSLLIVNDPRP